jgi:hypothetical protein
MRVIIYGHYRSIQYVFRKILYLNPIKTIKNREKEEGLKKSNTNEANSINVVLNVTMKSLVQLTYAHKKEKNSY